MIREHFPPQRTTVKTKCTILYTMNKANLDIQNRITVTLRAIVQIQLHFDLSEENDQLSSTYKENTTKQSSTSHQILTDAYDRQRKCTNITRSERKFTNWITLSILLSKWINFKILFIVFFF